MSNFELYDENGTQVNFKFDFYPTLVNPISWKKNVDKIPEFEIDYPYHHFEVIEVKKQMKVISGTIA